MFLRFFEILAVVAILSAGYGMARSAWSKPGEVVKNVPKEVRSSHAVYRTHYRSYYIHIGGK